MFCSFAIIYRFISSYHVHDVHHTYTHDIVRQCAYSYVCFEWKVYSYTHLAICSACLRGILAGPAPVVSGLGLHIHDGCQHVSTIVNCQPILGEENNMRQLGNQHPNRHLLRNICEKFRDQVGSRLNWFKTLHKNGKPLASLGTRHQFANAACIAGAVEMQTFWADEAPSRSTCLRSVVEGKGVQFFLGPSMTNLVDHQ